jgi:hypothetical protein
VIAGLAVGATILVAGRTASIFGDVAAVARYGVLGTDLVLWLAGFCAVWSVRDRGAIAYAADRMSRLFPAFWAGCAVAYVGAVLVPMAGPSPGMGALLANLAMVARYLHQPLVDPEYTILYRLQVFYGLVFVLLLVRGSRNPLPWLWAWLFGLVFLHVAPGLGRFGKLADVVLQPDLAGCLIAGAAVALMRRDGIARGPAILALVATAYAARKAWSNAADIGLDPTRAAMLVTAALLLAAAACLGWRAAASPRIADLARLTWPAFLLAGGLGVPALWASAVPLGRWGALAVAVAVVVAGAVALRRWVERPLAPRLRRALAAIPFARI